mmetsp:Transcript_5310/g.9970  ORF Transcript_5310/g.9970 Transcript_5310/m.9970 type:complete len:128 (+) Transcript_5310:127-510(+)
MVVQESFLVNRRSFKHNPLNGRTPLTYSVALNFSQQAYDLIELGADVNAAMPVENRADTTPHTALTIAATNSKRDGTDYGANLAFEGIQADELISAGVNEEGLNQGIKYWIDKARRFDVPPKTSYAI